MTGITTPVEFFALDSTNLDRPQLRWLEQRLADSRAAWKICFLHHPLYTSGRYRMASLVQRSALESLFVTHGVNAVFSGHEHIYQRSALVGGIQYFVSGGAGSLRPGDGVPTSYIARTYSDDYHFMLVEIEGDHLHFQAISRTGAHDRRRHAVARGAQAAGITHHSAGHGGPSVTIATRVRERAHPIVHGTDVAEQPALLIEPRAGKEVRGLRLGDLAEPLR